MDPGEIVTARSRASFARPARRAPAVVVVGAGAFGGWTALYLRQMGIDVTLVDTYGPGNSHATSGEETRSMTLWYLGAPGYGYGEIYSLWALRALERWKQWDEEWGKTLQRPLFVPSGRLVLRPEGWQERFEEGSRILDRYGIRNELLSRDEVAYRYPQIKLDDIEVGHYTPDAGLLRSRQACEAVAAAFRQAGGDLVIARAAPGRRSAGRLSEVVLTPGDALTAETFVFACGPWLPKIFPDVMGKRLQTTRGHVYYFGTPPGD
ncbi:MAG: FAD-binding oxidoreductase, partial [Gemmatimonadetes bacterium]|nr:FAD-binding oxidoreductase [Gemmatimonadota bacterium]